MNIQNCGHFRLGKIPVLPKTPQMLKHFNHLKYYYDLREIPILTFKGIFLKIYVR